MHDVAGERGPLLIKWMDSPARAFEHLLRDPLDELARMPTVQLWPFPSSASAVSYEAEEGWIELISLGNDIDEHGSRVGLGSEGDCGQR